MSCPHSTRFDTSPLSCSQCLGAVPRVITEDDVMRAVPRAPTSYAKRPTTKRASVRS